jgi:ankyrin repeat protein
MKLIEDPYQNELLFKILKYLKKNNLSINTTIMKNNNFLMYACFYGFPDIAKYLVENGININFTNLDGDTSLIIAARRQNYKIVKYLIEKDCLVDYNHELAHIFYLAFLF